MPEQTTTQLIQEFITHLYAAGRAQSTIFCYLHELDHLACLLGDKPAGRITDNDIDSAVARIAAEKRKNRKRSAATMNRIKSAYRSFLYWAFESERIPCNPAVRLRRARAYSCPTMPITAAEVAVLLRTIHQSDDVYADRDEALFATYAYTGIRRSEALSLTLRDYDRDNGVLCLPRMKNGAKQVKVVPPILTDMLTKRVRSALRECAPMDRLLLFPGRAGDKPLSPRHVRDRFDKWKKLAGIRAGLTIHSFRAGYATALYETTGDIFLVAHALGHRDIGTTMRYIRTNSSVLKRAVEYTFQRPGRKNISYVN